MANLKNTTIDDTGFLQLPVGTTAQRPSSPVNGYMRFNSDYKVVEKYVNGEWLSSPNFVKENLTILLDAGDPSSYSGSGTTWFDLSGNGYDVELVGPTFNASPGHFSFDGDDYGYVTTLNYGGGNEISQMSVFTWMRTTETGGTDGAYDDEQWSFLCFDRSEVFLFTILQYGQIMLSGGSSDYGGLGNNYDLIGRQQVNDGEWHNVGATFSVLNQRIVLYVDGCVDAVFQANNNMTNLGSGVTRYGFVGDGSEAGSENGNRNANYFTGDIAHLAFYDDKALTEEEVKQNFNALRGRFGV